MSNLQILFVSLSLMTLSVILELCTSPLIQHIYTVVIIIAWQWQALKFNRY